MYKQSALRYLPTRQLTESASPNNPDSSIDSDSILTFESNFALVLTSILPEYFIWRSLVQIYEESSLSLAVT